MKQIELTQGQFALVDDEDFDYLNQWKWYTRKAPRSLYAQRHPYITKTKKQTTLAMHREIMGITDHSIHVDHIDHNGLNNEKSNLRICSKQENTLHQQMSVKNTSGYKGVSWHTSKKKWRAQIGFHNKKTDLGHFNSKEDAARAYNEAALKYHGEFAKLNDVKKSE